MQIHTILLPTDFSPSAEHACHQGFALATREQDQVLLLHVLGRSHLAFGDTPLPMRVQLENEICAEAEQRLQGLAASQTVPVETLVVWGNPAAAICRIAQEREIDLIVMSTHGRTGLAHLFIGSVAERVVRHAPCSVLIIRTPQHEEMRRVRGLPHGTASSGRCKEGAGECGPRDWLQVLHIDRRSWSGWRKWMRSINAIIFTRGHGTINRDNLHWTHPQR